MRELVPSTVTSRSRERHETVPAPGTTGVTCLMRGLRSIAIVSSSVSSRAVSPISMPWIPLPLVSALPGSTISRCVPSEANWPVT